ncbi:expressed unknown protein [Seminavis robusta]|uniref:Uncharacterized protein n=1 Tax=Seminavis robusta TaxID=568900 RepID=A0A9N8E3Y9_9STRA|nr:expressed unknown protein [Seminavis robusta]|eukprot:Sro629_g178150.1 n/a (607) ;mRNA; r:6378-8198
MAPDANKKNKALLHVGAFLDTTVIYETNQVKNAAGLQENDCNDTSGCVTEEEPSLECVLQPRLLTDFSYVENPVRCSLRCQGTTKHLACNGKSAVFLQDSLATSSSSSSSNDEFAILPQADGSVLLRNTKTQQYLCSSTKGSVYASETGCDGMEQWIMTTNNDTSKERSYAVLSSLVSQRVLTCSGNTIHAALPEDINICNPKRRQTISWSLEFTSGELCFMSLPLMNKQVRCNLIGELSLSTNFQGWEAWRFSETWQHDNVRISPWAHSELFLASNEDGVVSCCTKEESAIQGSSTIWNVQKAPNGLYGVVIKAVVPTSSTSTATTGSRVLRYDCHQQCFCTIPDTALLLDESCVWDLESLHRQTYYLVTADNARRLEGAKRGITTRGYPGRLITEEWKIEPVPGSPKGIVRLYSNARQQYLVSDQDGEVSLRPHSEPSERDGSDHWVMEEREDGIVVRAYQTKRVLVAPDKGPVSTVEPGTIVHGNTRWRLEPKTPRQVSKEKLQGVGGAVAVGIIGTVATPLLIGAIGIGSIGVAGQVAIGSIRAVEALNTVTQVTLSSSQLMIGDSSSTFLSSADSTSRLVGSAGNDGGKNKTRPFCSWRSW